MLPETTARPRHRWRRWVAIVTGSLLLLVLTGALAFVVSPWPGSLVLRYLFDSGGARTAAAMTAHVPDSVSGQTNLAYGPGPDELLDVWYPTGTMSSLGTVLWVHGGGWVGGDKSTVAPYLKILASQGYTTVGINYSLAPGATYPTPVLQTNRALGWVTAHAAELHVDPTRVVLAGDSAGAQIAAQVASLIVNPAYAAQMQLTPTLPASSLVGTVLNCGPYDPPMIEGATGLDGWFIKTVGWAYLGTKDFTDPRVAQASIVDNVNASFPPAWVSGGNGDPLTPQGQALVAELTGLGVKVTPLFFPADYEPKLPHEYQFNLDTAAGQSALTGTVAFLAQVLR